MNKPIENVEYEQLVLGTAVISSTAANDILFEMTLDDFAIPQHKRIFSHLKAIYQKDIPFDISVIKTEIGENLSSCGGLDYLLQLFNTSVGIDYAFYCQELKNLKALRAIANASSDAMVQCYQSKAQNDEISTKLIADILNIQCDSNQKTKKAAEILECFSEHGTFSNDVFWRMDRAKAGLPAYTGIATNYPLLDKTLGFLKASTLTYIGARPSMGKTTFALNLIRSIYSTGKTDIPIGVFSLEMPADKLVAKMVCLMADVRFRSLDDGTMTLDQYNRIINRQEHLQKLPLYFEDEGGMTISKVRSRARRMVLNYGVKVIIIDYLTLIRSDTKYNSKHLQVDEVSKGLQAMAKELKVPVVCLAQLNRGASEAATNGQVRAPCLSDFRESGSIEEDCDVALMLHRPEYYQTGVNVGEMQVLVVKNRLRGELKKLNFKKSITSEVYNELPEIEDVMTQINERFRKGDD